MRIGVDLDGVVADFTQGWTSQYKKDFGKEIQEKDITEWGLSQPLTHFEEEIDFWNWAKNFNGYSIFNFFILLSNDIIIFYTKYLIKFYYFHDIEKNYNNIDFNCL